MVELVLPGSLGLWIFVLEGFVVFWIREPPRFRSLSISDSMRPVLSLVAQVKDLY